jgi:hypothetical protein
MPWWAWTLLGFSLWLAGVIFAWSLCAIAADAD